MVLSAHRSDADRADDGARTTDSSLSQRGSLATKHGTDGLVTDPVPQILTDSDFSADYSNTDVTSTAVPLPHVWPAARGAGNSAGHDVVIRPGTLGVAGT